MTFAFFDRFIQVRARRLEGRGQTEQYPCDHRYSGCKEQCLDIKLNVLGACQGICRGEREEEIEPPKRQHQTQRGAEQGKQNAFRQNLPHDAPAARSQRASQSDLVTPLGRTREQQIRDVNAGNE